MRRPIFCLLFLAFSVLAAAPSQAADNPFAVKDVKIDASAASASEAFNIAVDEGRQKAWVTLIHRLTRQEDWSRIPAIDEATLQRMVRGYQVSDERRSTTRYVANVTYIFNGELVRRYLRNADIAYADSAAPPLLIVPMAPDYSSDSAWTAAWSGNRMAAGAVPLDLPTGDALDRSLLGPIDFDSAGWSDVQPVASRVHAPQAALVLTHPPSDGHMTVRIRILSPSLPQTLAPVDVPVPSGASQSQAYDAAMQATAAAIGNAWKARSAIDFNQRSTLTASIRLPSLADWGTIQQRLEKVPIVTNVNVEAMDIGEARIVISYAGTMGQLNDFLSQAALQLSNRDGVWWLNAQSAPGGMGHP